MSLDVTNAATATLITCVRHPSELSASERAQMFELMTIHYENVVRESFERDLDEKEWVIVTTGADADVLGFSTLMRLTAELEGERLSALFSGDTVLDPSIWGDSSWVRAWGKLVGKVVAEWGESPVYWLLLTATHRTYHSLPLFLQEYYPRRGVETPRVFSRRMEALARLKFADEYDAARGVVRLKHPTPVRAERVQSAMEGLSDDDARFFAERNPTFLNGDDLVCIGAVTSDNRTRLGLRITAPPRE